MRTIPASELIINDDGSIFHLHLHPGQLADTVILVGDPGRVALVAGFFDTKECEVSNREFKTVTGSYKGKRMTVLSTGIGIGNIDICVTELDALANVDFATRQEKAEKKRLTLVRLGTSGAIQPDIKVGEFVFSRTSCGFDGLLSYYKGRDAVCDLALEEAFVKHTGWYEKMPRPYFVDADKTLFEHFSDVTREGITIAAPGFYAPQGRWVRLEPHDARLNEKIESFGYEGRRITNFEMEGSALAGLAALMGHRAATICTIIAQRIAQDVNTDYKPFVPRLVQIHIPKDSIGAVIGPGGKVIQEIQKQTGTTITITEDDQKGIVDVFGVEKSAIDAALQRIKEIVAVPEIGETYHGKIKSIVPFGAFVEIMPGKEALLHISEIDWKRFETMEESGLKEGEMIDVKLIGVDEKTGKLKLSHRALLPKPEGYVERERRPRGDRERRRDDRHRD